MHKFHLTIAVVAGLGCGLVWAGTAHAGTCQSVKAKGVGKSVAVATVYAQADLKQTANSLKGRVTQSSTSCGPATDGYKCKISAVVCPK
jgi:hypothetical protein